LNQHNSQHQVRLASHGVSGESGQPASHGLHRDESPSPHRKSRSSDEADSASGPPPDHVPDNRRTNVGPLGSSAPSHLTTERRTAAHPERSALASTAMPNPSYSFLVPRRMSSKSSTSLSRSKPSPEDPVLSLQPHRSADRVRRFVVVIAI
jgi:hypothetical protein